MSKLTQPKKTPIHKIAKSTYCDIVRLGRHAVKLVPLGPTVWIDVRESRSKRKLQMLVKNVGLFIVGSKYVKEGEKTNLVLVALRGPDVKETIKKRTHLKISAIQ